MATNLPPPPRKADERFDNWVFTLWKRAVSALVSGGVGVTAPIIITTSGTGTLNLGHSTSGVVTGTYGSQSRIPIVAVNTYGHVTLATSSDVAIGGTAVTGSDLTVSAPLTGTATNALLRAGTIGHGTSGVIGGTYGGTLGIPRVVVDTWGHVTSGTNLPLQATAPILLGSNAGTFTWGHSTSGAIGGTYGSRSTVPIIVVDTWGHLTLATSSAIAIDGTHVTGTDLVVSAPLVGTATNALLRSGTVGHGTSGVIGGTYGGALGIPRVIVDTWGHVTAGTSFPLQATAPILVGSNAGTFTWGHSTSGITAGTFGSASVIPQVVVDTWGHVTAINTLNVAVGGTAVTGSDLTISSPLVGTVTNALLRAGTVAHGTSGVVTGTYGGASVIPQVVVNTYGHITAVNTLGVVLGNLVTNVQNGAYTLGTGDVNNLVYRAGTATGVTTWTVPSTLGTGALVSLINDGTGNVTVSAVGTLVFAGTGATGNRTLPQYGMASVVSVGTSRWYISGAGVS